MALNSPAAGVGQLLTRVQRVGKETIPLALASGRILAQPVAADRDNPAVDVSAMDGYAVRVSDLNVGTLPITGDVRIGREPPPQPARAALRIVTGAPIPPGADAVIKREDVQESPDRITLTTSVVKPGTHIRRRAENAPAGHKLIDRGVEITMPIAAALASFGVANPTVHKKIRVGVLVTGDEVLGVEQSPAPWQLRDSNGPAILSLLARRPWIEAIPHPRAPDDPQQLRKAVTSLLDRCDAIIATGGVSMGDRDFFPQVARDVGAEVVFHRISQRPGKPVFGAILPDGRPIFGLPGNPLSVMVTLRRMAFPILERVAGLDFSPFPCLVRLDNPDDRRLDLWWHRLVRSTGPRLMTLVNVSSSGDVASATASDGFVEVPPDQTGPGPWPYFPWSF
jgi:molybdopterin molybdotransferase